MATPECLFDLVTEPWLPVKCLDGSSGLVGLKEALVRAHDIAGLDLDYPTQEPALLRLLLACCYRALEGPADEAEWEELWRAPTLPSAAFDAYFDKWSARFDLFSSTEPFFQSPGLESAGKDGAKPASKLVAYAPSGNNVPLFMPITDDGSFVLSPADAARWLVERHAWGSTSDKSGARGNPRVKGGKDAPGIGHVAWIGFVAPIGATLRETLLLNLVPWDRCGRAGPDDRPAWERPPLGPARETRPPDGVCDLFTWQGRRILLHPEVRGDETVVAKVLICAGDEVDREAVRGIDPHCGWRGKKQKDGTIDFFPVRARLGQQVWRGLGSLLALGEDEVRAPVLSWLARIESAGVSQVSLLVTAAEFGSMSTVLIDLLSDRLDQPVALLRSDNLEAATVAEEAAKLADAAAKAVGRVGEVPYLSYDLPAGRLRIPEGRTEQAADARKRLAEELYAALDSPFRRFFVELTSYDDVQDARRPWAETVEQAARAIVDRQMSQLTSAQAFAGADRESWFSRELSKACSQFTGENAITKGAR